nr:hypothetical protein OG781_10450 [Streptomyces sp. NBC_00830]
MSDEGLRWAQGILDAHPSRPAVLTTHDRVNRALSVREFLTPFD